jgi:hypothetical protein
MNVKIQDVLLYPANDRVKKGRRRLQAAFTELTLT